MGNQSQKQLTDQSQQPSWQFKPGVSGNPRGRPSAKAQAEADEAERQALERELLADLHREPSVTERIAVETLSAQVIRARRMRQTGRHEQAEMAERLITRSLGRLGIRQGAIKPRLSLAERMAAEAAAEGRGEAGQSHGTETGSV